MNEQPERLRSNEYWGKRSGAITPKEGPHFKGKKWNQGQKHSGPSSERARRFYAERAASDRMRGK